MRMSDWSSDLCSADLDQGLSGIENNFLKRRPIDEQRRIGAELARRDMEMGCFVNNVASWDKPLWASGDVSDQAALQAELQESIEVAVRANGRVVDRKSVVWGQSESVRVGLGGGSRKQTTNDTDLNITIK